MYIVDGVLFRGQQVVIPGTMRQDMLNRIHEGHLGIVKLKKRARQCLYWPGITKDIVEMAEKCEVCMKHRYKQAPQPLTQEIQQFPWHKVGVDIFTLGSKNYLLTIDYFSNYPEVQPLKHKDAKSVIRVLKSVFARHGIPVELTSDNVPFNSYEFMEFSKHYGFNFSPTSPNHPNSNGKAEKGVQIVKRILKKCYENDDDPFLAILSYRNTPLECGKSPAQLLMNRQLRTRLPHAYFEAHQQDEETLRKLDQSKQKQKHYFDKHARTLKPLSEGQIVRMYDSREGKYPKKGIVLKEHSHQSYRVVNKEGRELRRNRDHLIKTGETYTPMVDYDNLEVPQIKNQEPIIRPVQQTVHDTGIEQDQVRHEPELDNLVPHTQVYTERPRRVSRRPKRLIEEG